MTWTLDRVAQALRPLSGSSVSLPAGTLGLHGISTDSRHVAAGDVFVALRGERFAASILELGRRYHLVTPNTSRLGLETLEQHLEHQVPPAPTRVKMRKAYDARAVKVAQDEERRRRVTYIERRDPPVRTEDRSDRDERRDRAYDYLYQAQRSSDTARSDSLLKRSLTEYRTPEAHTALGDIRTT